MGADTDGADDDVNPNAFLNLNMMRAIAMRMTTIQMAPMPGIEKRPLKTLAIPSPMDWKNPALIVSDFALPSISDLVSVEPVSLTTRPKSRAILLVTLFAIPCCWTQEAMRSAACVWLIRRILIYSAEEPEKSIF